MSMSLASNNCLILKMTNLEWWDEEDIEEEVGGGGDEENESSKSFSDLTKSITILSFTLNVFFFFTDFFFLLIPKLKKYIY